MALQTYIILLRAINVSGKNIIPMKDLRDLLLELSFNEVQTYIQSGNIVLSSSESLHRVEEIIKEGISTRFQLDIEVIGRTVEAWKEVIAANPYKEEDPKKQYFTFLAHVPEQTSMEYQSPNDEYTIINDVVYLYCREGRGNTKLSNELFEKKLKVPATSRNYRTTYKLWEMAQ